MRVALPLLLCALSTAAPAAEVILVARGARESPVVQQLREQVVNGVQVAAGYPRVMRSDEIPGLEPGKLVTVVGFCSDRKAALRVVEALKGKLPVLIRTVEGEWSDACPHTKPPRPQMSTLEAQLRKHIEDDPESEDALYEYAKFLQTAGRLGEAQVQIDRLLELNPENADARTLQGVIRVLQTGEAR